MAGILESLGLATGDPKKDASLNYGLLQAGLSLLNSRGNFGSALGQAGQAGLLGSQQFQQQQHQRQLQQWQADEMKRKQAMQALPQQFARTPAQTALAGGGGPTLQNAEAMKTAAPSFDYEGYADSLAQYDPVQAMNLKASLAQKQDLMTVAPGGIVIDKKTGRPVFTAPSAPEKEPEAIRALKAIYGEDSPEYAQRAREYGRKMSTHAPGTQVNVNQPKMKYDPARGVLINEYTGDVTRATLDGKPLGSADEAKEREGAKQRYGQLMAAITEARKLLPKATGSGAGALLDQGAGFFGQSTQGADASSQLETLAGWMTSNVPRMQGPQSDRDAILYRQMAAQVGDSKKPISQRVKALETLETIQRKYAEVNGVQLDAQEPKPRPGIPQPGTVQDGYRFKGGDPANANNWERM